MLKRQNTKTTTLQTQTHFKHKHMNWINPSKLPNSTCSTDHYYTTVSYHKWCDRPTSDSDMHHRDFLHHKLADLKLTNSLWAELQFLIHVAWSSPHRRPCGDRRERWISDGGISCFRFCDVSLTASASQRPEMATQGRILQLWWRLRGLRDGSFWWYPCDTDVKLLWYYGYIGVIVWWWWFDICVLVE